MFQKDKIKTYLEKNFRDNLNIDEFKSNKACSIMFNGPAGSVKTYKLIDILLQEKNPLVLSRANKAVDNVQERLKRRIRQNNHDIDFTEDEVSNICRTFDSYFCEWNENNIKLIKDKTIFIDKFSMVLNKVITILYKLWLEHNIKIYMFGDPNHCNRVES